MANLNIRLCVNTDEDHPYIAHRCLMYIVDEAEDGYAVVPVAGARAERYDVPKSSVFELKTFVLLPQNPASFSATLMRALEDSSVHDAIRVMGDQHAEELQAIGKRLMPLFLGSIPEEFRGLVEAALAGDDDDDDDDDDA